VNDVDRLHRIRSPQGDRPRQHVEQRSQCSSATFEIDALEDELAEEEARPPARDPGPPATKHVPIGWCDRDRGVLEGADEWDVAGPWAPTDHPAHATLYSTPFADWLDGTITSALAARRSPVTATSDPLAPARASAQELPEILVDTGAIETSSDFDESSAAEALAASYGDSAAFYAKLLDCPGIDEVFLSEDDLELHFERMGAEEDEDDDSAPR